MKLLLPFYGRSAEQSGRQSDRRGSHRDSFPRDARLQLLDPIEDNHD